MSDVSANHRHAAARHELAARNHERAARFWDDQGDRERAELQREMAKREHHGADLELRWAELVDPDAARYPTRAADLVVSHSQESAKQVSSMLNRTAGALERSAGLAEAHAHRDDQAGRPDAAAEERQAAERSREAAQRARSQAEEWLKATKNRHH